MGPNRARRRNCKPPFSAEHVRNGSWLCENSEIDFANRNFVLTSINLKNKSAGDGCRDKTIEKTILRTFRARTFSRSLGQSLPKWGGSRYVRYAPDSDRRTDMAGGPKGATSGLMRCNNRRPASDYSITSSARPRSGSGTAMPSAFAVLRLMTNSNLATCCTGKSAAFSPLRIRPT
jgi:hypothetical protein